MMRLSEQGRALIKGAEGLRLEAYPDGQNPDGSPRYSIGWGHNGVSKGARITREQADSLFLSDAARFEKAVSDLVASAPTTQNQFDALTSLAFNIGEGAKGLGGSTLLQFHNAGDYVGAAEEFPRWVHAGGVVDSRLVDRRAKERALYLTPPSVVELPPMASSAPSRAPLAASAGLIFFCPCCGERCAASLDVRRAV
jgi:lysozyme